jgi:uncharacterized protein DUF4328/uncharacterized protein DUF4339
MNWYYAKGGTQFGPISDAEFMARRLSGEISPESYVWQPQFENWKLAKELPGLFTSPKAAVALGGQTQAKVTIGLLIAGGVLDVISFLLSASGDVKADVIVTLGILQLLLYWTTAGFFAAWAYQAYQNLKAFRVRNLRFTPGWAAGGFFVPFLNFVRPFQVFRELWKASDPSSNEENWVSASTGPLLIAWWAGFLFMCLLGQIALHLPTDVDASGFGMFSDLVSIAATVLAILVVRKINERQQTKATLTA